MKTVLSFLIAAILCLTPALSHAAENVVGEILEVEGKGSITGPDGQSYDAAVKSPVHPQDIISTGPGSRIYIQFIDNTEFTLSENAQFTVEEYNYNDKDKNKNYATYSVLKGAFLYVSGLVAKKDEPDVRVNIPQGSIGIRGTKFWGGTVNGDYGVIVGEGKVVVKNKAGATTLTRGQGTTLKGATIAPEGPTLWSQAKIDLATQTVELKNAAAIGQRMAEARALQPALIEQHKAAAATITRESAEVIEQRVEQRLLQLMAPAEVIAPSPVATPEVEQPTNTLRDRLERKRIDSTSQQKVIERLNSTETPAKRPVTETIRPLNSSLKRTTDDVTGAPAQLIESTGETVKPVTDTVGKVVETTTEIVRETTDKATEAGTRVIDTTVKTTTAVTDTATDTVRTSTDVVKQVTETPVVKGTAQSVNSSVRGTAQSVVSGSRGVATPATDALKNLTNRNSSAK